MTEDWNVCASISLKTQLINKAILSHRFSKCIIGAYTTSVIVLGAGNILAQKSAGSEQSVQERQLIVRMKLPFEYSASPIYEIVIVTQFLLQYTLAITAAMLNALIVSLVSWLCTGERGTFFLSSLNIVAT